MQQVQEKPQKDALTSFQRLQNELGNVISSASPGEKLPSEPVLAKMLGVSRATLREAMRTFEGQGIIRRRQGVGTFVVGHIQVIETGLEVLESIETLAEKIGLDVKMGELKLTQIDANEYYAKNLNVEVNTPLIKISRVFNAEKRPVAFLEDVLPESIFSSCDLSAGFTGSVLDRLIESKKVDLTISKTVIQAEAATSSIARALQIQRGDVLLLFKAHLFSNDGKIVDYSYSYFLPGYFRFHVMRRVGEQKIKKNGEN